MPSANQFTTNGGAGYDPEEDQRKRSLGSELNAGGGLPNMDPLKMSNPYAGGNPYAGDRAPLAGNSQNRAPGAPAEAGNPYRSPASAQAQPGSAQGAVQRQAQAQAAPQQAPQQLSVSSTGTYKPVQMDAYGQGLQAAAGGQQTGAQMEAERIAADDYYKDNATRAAEQHAAGGGVGAINDMATRIAQAGEAQRTQARAADTAAARTAFGQYRESEIERERSAQERETDQKRIDAQLFQAQLDAETARHAQDTQREIARKNREAELWRTGAGLVGGAIGSIGGPVGTAVGKGLGEKLFGPRGG